MSSKRSINGKTFETVLFELEKEFPKSAFKTRVMDGVKYLPIEVITERFNSVIGPFNYDFVCTEPQIVQVGTRDHVVLTGTLTIKDDAGVAVASRSSGGGTNIIVAKVTGEATAVKNDAAIASGDVFKRCCRLFGVGDEQMRSIRNGGGKRNISANSYEEPDVTMYQVKIKQNFSQFSKGYKTVVDVEGNGELELVIWDSSAKKEIEKHLPIAKFIKLYKPGNTLKLFGYENEFKGIKQLVMERPAVKEDEL